MGRSPVRVDLDLGERRADVRFHLESGPDLAQLVRLISAIIGPGPTSLDFLGGAGEASPWPSNRARPTTYTAIDIYG